MSRALPVRHLGAILAIVVLCVGGQALAASPSLLGSYRDWDAYAVSQDGHKSCYAVSSPTKPAKPKDLTRDRAFLVLTTRPGGQGAFEPNLIAGFALKPEVEVKTLIGSQRFSLFAKGDGAWIRAREDERRFLVALRGGTALVAQMTSASGVNVVDTFSLQGLSAALTAAQEACK